MTREMKIFLLLIVSAMGLTYPVGAQQPEDAKAEPKGGRTCRIVFPERPGGAPKSAYLFDGKASQRVTLPSMNFSEVIGLPPGELVIVMTADEITDPEVVPPSAPKLRITEGVRDFYILVTPDPDNAAFPVRMNIVDTGGGKLKAGETLWFNLTEHRILGMLGDRRMSVAPEGRTVSEDPVPSSGYYRAEFAFQPEGEGKPQRITEQRWWHDAESRHVGFIVNTGGKLPKLYFFRDFR